jgi:hypothetical protein
MSLKYSAFISYLYTDNVGGGLTGNIAVALKQKLVDLLKFRIPCSYTIFLDKDNLCANSPLDDSIAEAICQSLCMIAIIAPAYGIPRYCLREFTAMEVLEKRRLGLLHGKDSEIQGLIIPVIIRGNGFMPDKIIKRPCFDFSDCISAKFTRKDQNQIEMIAEYICLLYGYFEPYIDNSCFDSKALKLPNHDEMKVWKMKGMKEMPFTRI